MTKSLTEKWRDGTLPNGWYYCHCYDEVKKLYCGDGESLELDDPETVSYYFFHRENGKGQVEVLAPVPSYEEVKHWDECANKIMDEVEKLQEQLKEANEVIKWYAKPDSGCAKDYLKKWGVK